jgi:hypothetical protein
MEDYNKFIQPSLVGALILFVFCLLFFKVPTANDEYIKMLLTAIISFVSGSAVTKATQKISNRKGGQK